MSSLYERAGEVFLAALSLPADQRDRFLIEACKGDEELLQEVGSLLLFHGTGDGPEAHPAATVEFSAGEVFANRYRMIARVGRGGMGDVWRADDLTLETTVALKLMHSARSSDRTRILQEVRLARQITHRAVCRVFDVGEAGETIFYSMQFVEGEDLSTLLRRSGRLTSERVLDIAHQLCAGLAAAHAEGVLHRDLKPANILIDQEGRVRITDFGIAVVTGDAGPHAMIGTLGYMAPEQLAGEALSERTDVYALGAVLFELVTGQPHHMSRPEDPVSRLSLLAPGINPRLESAILKATARDPEDRPATAFAMAAALPDPDTAAGRDAVAGVSTRNDRPKPRWLAAVSAVVALVAAAAIFAWTRPTHTALTARDTIILADVLNTTGDPVFDSTLNVALAVALEQSPFLKVFPDERAHEYLPLLEHSPNEGITRALARQIAQRQQLKALIAGSIMSLGSHYVVGLEAVNAESGEVMAREQVEVNSKEEVLTALGAAVSRLRRTLGESLASIQRYDVPLPQATTPSLEALQVYARSLDEGRINPRRESIPHLMRAIELDPNFALAQAQLSGIYANTGQSALAPEWSRRAFELRDRVSERERYFISWRYYRDALQAWDQALELARSWTAAYPRESFAFNSFGSAAQELGQYQQAIAPLRESIRLDPKFISPTPNLISALTALNQFDEAAVVLEVARAAVEHVAINREAYTLAFIRNDSAGMARELDAVLGTTDRPLVAGWRAGASAFGGQIEKAHEEFRQSVAALSQANRTEQAGQYGAQDAVSHAIVGQCAEARREASEAIGLSRDNFTLESAGSALAWCGADEEASDLSGELARRFPQAILTTHVMLPVIAAATAIKRGNATRGLELLEPVRRFDHAPVARFWPAYLRGEAQLLLKRGAEAAVEFRSIIDHRGEQADSPLYPLAHLGLARALALGVDRAAARQAYSAFFTLWKDADPDLLPLREARMEFARLQP